MVLKDDWEDGDAVTHQHFNDIADEVNAKEPTVTEGTTVLTTSLLH